MAPSSLGLSGPQSPAFLHSLPPSPNQEPEINTKKILLKNVAFQGVFRDLLQVRLGDGFADCCIWSGWHSGHSKGDPSDLGAEWEVRHPPSVCRNLEALCWLRGTGMMVKGAVPGGAGNQFPSGGW